MRLTSVAGFALALCAVTTPLHSQAVIETQSGWDGEAGFYPFGVDGTDAYGQTFMAPAQYLNSWSLWMRSLSDGGDVTFTANIGTWTGSSVGAVLWTSALTPGTSSSSYQQYQFNTGGVSLLTGGQTYIFFLDAVSGLGTLQVAGFGGSYAGGSFNYHNDIDHADNWDGLGFPDLVFRAEFDRVPGEQDVVPEPATMTLLATGLAGMAAARRRKAKQS